MNNALLPAQFKAFYDKNCGALPSYAPEGKNCPNLHAIRSKFVLKKMLKFALLKTSFSK